MKQVGFATLVLMLLLSPSPPAVAEGPAAPVPPGGEGPVVQKFMGPGGWEDPRPAPDEAALNRWRGRWRLAISDPRVPWATSELVVDGFEITHRKDVYPLVRPNARISLPRGWENEAGHFALEATDVRFDWDPHARKTGLRSIEWRLEVERKEEGRQIWRFRCHLLPGGKQLAGVCLLEGGEESGLLATRRRP